MAQQQQQPTAPLTTLQLRAALAAAQRQLDYLRQIGLDDTDGTVRAAQAYAADLGAALVQAQLRDRRLGWRVVTLGGAGYTVRGTRCGRYLTPWGKGVYSADPHDAAVYDSYEQAHAAGQADPPHDDR